MLCFVYAMNANDCEECEYLQRERAGMFLSDGMNWRRAERIGSKDRCHKHTEEEYDMEDLNDSDLMPFGKYKGKLMWDVPVGYLNHLWNSGMKTEINKNNVARYIQRSLSALKLEDEDLIWD